MINLEYNFPNYVTFSDDCIINAIQNYVHVNSFYSKLITNYNIAGQSLSFISLAQWKLIISFIEPNEIQFFCEKIFYEWWPKETKYSFLLCKGQNLSIKSHPLNSYYKVLPWRLHKRISSVLHYNSIKILNGILFFTNLFCFGS